jgi:hypothetical protein
MTVPAEQLSPSQAAATMRQAHERARTIPNLSRKCLRFLDFAVFRLTVTARPPRLTCRVSVPEVARMAGVSERSVPRYLRELTEAGVTSWVPGGGRGAGDLTEIGLIPAPKRTRKAAKSLAPLADPGRVPGAYAHKADNSSGARESSGPREDEEQELAGEGGAGRSALPPADAVGGNSGPQRVPPTPRADDSAPGPATAELLQKRRPRGERKHTTRPDAPAPADEAVILAEIDEWLAAGLLVEVEPGGHLPDDEPLCRYPSHRAAECDWHNPGGRLICGICRPKAEARR